jgi:hypothetical protein
MIAEIDLSPQSPFSRRETRASRIVMGVKLVVNSKGKEQYASPTSPSISFFLHNELFNILYSSLPRLAGEEDLEGEVLFTISLLQQFFLLLISKRFKIRFSTLKGL